MPIELVHGFLAISADTYPEGRFSVLGGGFEAIEVSAYGDRAESPHLSGVG